MDNLNVKNLTSCIGKTISDVVPFDGCEEDFSIIFDDGTRKDVFVYDKEGCPMLEVSE